jgi:hypothetical protein
MYAICVHNDARDPSSERLNCGQEMTGNFADNGDFHVIVWIFFLHTANLRHGTDGFTSPPKEGVLRIFSPWKIRRLRPGLNPRTRVFPPVSSGYTTPCSDHSHRPPEVVETYSSRLSTRNVIMLRWLNRNSDWLWDGLPGSRLDSGVESLGVTSNRQPRLAHPPDWLLKWPEGKASHSFETSAKVTNATSYSSIPLPSL